YRYLEKCCSKPDLFMPPLGTLRLRQVMHLDDPTLGFASVPQPFRGGFVKMPDDKKAKSRNSAASGNDGFLDERRSDFTDLETVESQRNDLTAEEFPEGPYGA